MRHHRRLFPILAILAAAAPLASCDTILSPDGAVARDLRSAPEGIARGTCLEVEGMADPSATGYIVTYHQGVPVEPTTAQLAAKYHFTPRFVFAILPGFSAELSNAAVKGLRCHEPVIAGIAHNAVAIAP